MEKQRFLCISCLNSHLLLQSINIYCKSKSLPSHKSLTDCINCIFDGERFEETNDTKLCKFAATRRLQRVTSGKKGNQSSIRKLLALTNVNLSNILWVKSKIAVPKTKNTEPTQITVQRFSLWWKINTLENS